MKKFSKRVYFVRHGQSEANISPVFQPLDSPLTQRGREQAAFVAGRVSHLPIEFMISSPLPRAAETAQIIAGKIQKGIDFSDLFVERRKPSGLSGRSHDDVDAQRLMNEWEESLFVPGTRVYDGENFDDLRSRATQALAYLAKRPETELLVVTHGYFLRYMTACVLLGEDFGGKAFQRFASSVSMENTALSIFRLVAGEKQTWKLWVWNDHAHLAEPT